MSPSADSPPTPTTAPNTILSDHKPQPSDPNPQPQPQFQTENIPPIPNTTTMIVPTDDPNIESVTPREFPPDDARAMSPRRTNENLTGMCEGAREKIQSSTIEHQAGLAALVEKIEEVKTGHEKLERDNNALQEYIGGLTRSMSKTDLAGGGRAGHGTRGKK